MTNERVAREIAAKRQAAKMKALRPLILVTNWTAILTLPIWGGFAVAFMLLQDRGSEQPRRWLRGERWIFS